LFPGTTVGTHVGKMMDNAKDAGCTPFSKMMDNEKDTGLPVIYKSTVDHNRPCTICKQVVEK